MEPDWGGWADELPDGGESLLGEALGGSPLGERPELDGGPGPGAEPDFGGEPEPDAGPPADGPGWDGDHPGWGGTDSGGFGSGFSGVDAHVDEPLFDPDIAGAAGADLPETAGADGPGADAGPGAGHGGEPPDEPPPPAPPAAAGAGDWPAPVTVADPLFGTDPDAGDLAGAEGWAAEPFPPVLELADLAEPVDGPPWADAALLGAEPLPEATAGPGTPDPVDLSEYAAMDLSAVDGDPWQALLASDDPATSALARWWAPPPR